jgi:hypothetical protein
MKRYVLVAVAALLVQAPAIANQPNMEAALASLNQAKESLQKATEDKGGHRAKPIKSVNEAIRQVKAGIEFDRTHWSPNEGQKK